jgi:predicted CoA-substrate-specific enzyme activase
MKIYLGIDVGSISTNVVAITDKDEVLSSLYIRTEGDPINSVKRGLKEAKLSIPEGAEVCGVGATGSARYLIGVITGADLIKNEITAHAKGASFFVPDVKTVLEIGGQDSKIIILENGVAVDFAMNAICAAGTGSFLDSQAYRLKIPIEQFGDITLTSEHPTTIASRCTVFAESDMIHKQQIGHKIEDIVAGLCQGLARNYLAGVAKGKDIKEPIVFQGGVSENKGMVAIFEKELGKKITVPKYNKVMGAFGVALLARDYMQNNEVKTKFRGWDISDREIKCSSFNCNGCPNRCEVIEAKIDGKVVSRWGDRCGKWSSLKTEEE